MSLFYCFTLKSWMAKMRQHTCAITNLFCAGKSAVTVFERESVAEDGSESIIRCRPVTGRTHQIRVHLQWLGEVYICIYRTRCGNTVYSLVPRLPKKIRSLGTRLIIRTCCDSCIMFNFYRTSHIK